MIIDFWMSTIRENDTEHFWFQHDGAPLHTARATILFAVIVPWSLDIKKRWFWLVPGFTGFDIAGPFSLGLLEVEGLCQQAKDSKRTKRKLASRNSRHIIRKISKYDGKYRKTGLLRHLELGVTTCAISSSKSDVIKSSWIKLNNFSIEHQKCVFCFF